MRKYLKLISLSLLVVLFQSNIAKDKVGREMFLEHLKMKNSLKKPLVVHVLVPLCDNENQGIVPVSKTLGNGQDPRNNLYWGALYGMKTHFKKSANWFFKKSYNPQAEEILERIIFESTNSKGNQVILIADAYRGDEMVMCLNHYFNYLGGGKKLNLPDSLGYSNDVDLVVFNGHNGLMDNEIKIPSAKAGHKKLEAMAIGCASYDYFQPYWGSVDAFPLLSTNNLMAPEAYILHKALDAWKEMKSKESIHLAAASGYNQYQKCGVSGAKRLFRTGWKD